MCKILPIFETIFEKLDWDADPFVVVYFVLLPPANRKCDVCIRIQQKNSVENFCLPLRSAH